MQHTACLYDDSTHLGTFVTMVSQTITSYSLEIHKSANQQRDPFFMISYRL